MEIGIIGNGTLASSLGRGWADVGHEVRMTGRDPGRVAEVAARVGATAVTPDDLAAGCDAVLLAVRWEGVVDALAPVAGALAGVPLIDPTNAVAHGVGRLLTDTSAAEVIAEQAPGAHVVKAFHLYAADQWSHGPSPTERAVVPMVGDDAGALEVVGRLVADVGGTPVVLGGLDRARQLEEAAGFVIGLAFNGADPRAAVPHVPT